MVRFQSFQWFRFNLRLSLSFIEMLKDVSLHTTPKIFTNANITVRMETRMAVNIITPISVVLLECAVHAPVVVPRGQHVSTL